MKLIIVNVRTCEVDTDAWREYFGTKDTNAQIVAQFLNDNGQLSYLAGDLNGWINESISFTTGERT